MSHHSCIWPFGVRISITQESAGNKNKQLKQEFAKQGCHYKRKELPASILRYRHFTRAPFLLHIQAHFIQIQGGVQAFRATLQKHESKAVGCTYQHVLTIYISDSQILSNPHLSPPSYRPPDLTKPLYRETFGSDTWILGRLTSSVWKCLARIADASLRGLRRHLM